MPSGWFGRPYDNGHTLTSVVRDGNELAITLDDHQVLRVTDPRVVAVDNRALRISGFSRGTWDWTAYGSDERHHEEFGGGAIEFFA